MAEDVFFKYRGIPTARHRVVRASHPPPLMDAA
jgi:hypothetical protein